MEGALIERLAQFQIPYVVLMPDMNRALACTTKGFRSWWAGWTIRRPIDRARVDRASLVAATLTDTENTNVVLSVREACETVPIVATAAWEASVDMLLERRLQGSRAAR